MKRNGKVQNLVWILKHSLKEVMKKKLWLERCLDYSMSGIVLSSHLSHHLLFSMFLRTEIEKLLLKVTDQENGVMWFLYTYRSLPQSKTEGSLQKNWETS